jgi:hypothetical protein
VTATKTSAYTAAVAELVMCNASTAGFTVTMPTNVADKSRIIVKKIDSSANIVTVTTSGTDVWNSSGSGITSLTLPLMNQALTAQYQSSTGVWIVVNTDIPLTAADTRYLNQNTTGSAATLTTGRTVQTSLSSTSSATFDGSANITPGVTGTLPVGNGGTGATTLTGLVKGTGTTAMVAATAGTDYMDATDVSSRDLTSGESTLPRLSVIGSVNSGSGFLRLTFFTARKTETITSVRITTASTAASGATLCRIGIYSEDASGNLTLVASTPTDTTQWIAASTAYTKALSASFSKVRGTRYGVGPLFVGTTAPTFYGHGALPAAESGQSPRLGGFQAGLSDLPSTITNANVTVQANLSYIALIP